MQKTQVVHPLSTKSPKFSNLLYELLSKIGLSYQYRNCYTTDKEITISYFLKVENTEAIRTRIHN